MPFDQYNDKEAESLKEDAEKLEEEERKYAQEELSNTLKNPGEVFINMNDMIYGYDAISVLNNELEGKVGSDTTFNIWEANVNSK